MNQLLAMRTLVRGVESGSFSKAAVITFGGFSGFLVMLGAGMAAAVIALLLVRSHLPGKKSSARLATANAKRGGAVFKLIPRGRPL